MNANVIRYDGTKCGAHVYVHSAPPQKGEEWGGSGSAGHRCPSLGESTEQEEEEEAESKLEEPLSIEGAEGAGQFGGDKDDDGAPSTSGLEFAASPERLVDEQVSQVIS